MRAGPMAPACTESASVFQSQALREPSKKGAFGIAAATAWPKAVVQPAVCSGETLGTAQIGEMFFVVGMYGGRGR